VNDDRPEHRERAAIERARVERDDDGDDEADDERGEERRAGPEAPGERGEEAPDRHAEDDRQHRDARHPLHELADRHRQRRTGEERDQRRHEEERGERRGGGEGDRERDPPAREVDHHVRGGACARRAHQEETDRGGTREAEEPHEEPGERGHHAVVQRDAEREQARLHRAEGRGLEVEADREHDEREERDDRGTEGRERARECVAHERRDRGEEGKPHPLIVWDARSHRQGDARPPHSPPMPESRRPSELPELPLSPLLPALAAALREARSAVLEAPPGAGKSTLAPLALLPDQAGRILMLEPRRLAARAVALRMAELLGERVGERVGYRTRLESRVSGATRIEVVTEGILTRRLQSDPGLAGVSLLIFDEFHERSIHADLGLALALDARAELGASFAVLVMSATLEGERVAQLLGASPRLRSQGKSHPVEILYRPVEELARGVAATVRAALRTHEGDVLVFLPGAAEIRRVERLLAEDLPRDTAVLPLFGDLPAEAQDAALKPAPPGRRKVVLATSIAETSLTLPGVRVVIDSTLARSSRFDPVTGLAGLVTGKAARAALAQRAGRAGRTAPGACFRLCAESDAASRAEHARPEILSSDLAPLALELALWGAPLGRLRFLDPPPAPALAMAGQLLAELGAMRGTTLTAEGRRMAGMGLHPRLARILLEAERANCPRLGAELAALITERDIVRGQARDADLRKRLLALRGEEAGLEVDRGALERVRRLADRYAPRGSRAGDVDAAGSVLATGYPDRVAKRRGSDARFLLSSGRGAHFRETDALAREPYLAIAELSDETRDARILLAAPVSEAELETALAARIASVERVGWDGDAVIARRERRLGELVLSVERIEAPDESVIAEALLAGLAELTPARLRWSARAAGLRDRIAFLARVDGAGSWPAVGDEAMAADLRGWFAAHLVGLRRRAELVELDLEAVLRARLTPAQQKSLERLAPERMRVPSGREHVIDYGADGPSLAVKLQEMFGASTTPTVVGGGVPLLLKLLSPAGRPVQQTRDLAGFWARGYAEVRKELKGRYPKHPWPEDPLAAVPTASAKPRR
jgi:ATP-dependent helicase HrpB